MDQPIPLREADGVEVTILVDNQIDALLGGDEQVRRKAWGPRVHNSLIDAPEVATTLHAEHGFAALVTLHNGGERHQLLFDSGLSPDGLIANMDRMELDAKEIEAVVLSHGHLDHTGGLDGLVRRLGRPGMPLIVHPRAYTKRRSAPPGVEPTALPPPSRSGLERAGFELIETEQPSLIFKDGLAVTGEIPRVTDFEQGFPFFEQWDGTEWVPEPHLLDDQGIVVNVRGKGLVVLTGCGHSGIVNIVKQAQALTGVERVSGVLGGFHLPGPVFEPVIPRVIDELRAIAPDVLLPGHCTGWKAQHALAAAMPEAYVQNSVGTTIVF